MEKTRARWKRERELEEVERKAKSEVFAAAFAQRLVACIDEQKKAAGKVRGRVVLSAAGKQAAYAKATAMSIAASVEAAGSSVAQAAPPIAAAPYSAWPKGKSEAAPTSSHDRARPRMTQYEAENWLEAEIQRRANLRAAMRHARLVDTEREQRRIEEDAKDKQIEQRLDGSALARESSSRGIVEWLLAENASQWRLDAMLVDYGMYAAEADEVRARHAADEVRARHAAREATHDRKRTRREEDGDAQGRLSRAGSQAHGRSRRTVWRTHGWPSPMHGAGAVPSLLGTGGTASAAAGAVAGASAVAGTVGADDPDESDVGSEDDEGDVDKDEEDDVVTEPPAAPTMTSAGAAAGTLAGAAAEPEDEGVEIEDDEDDEDEDVDEGDGGSSYDEAAEPAVDEFLKRIRAERAWRATPLGPELPSEPMLGGLGRGADVTVHGLKTQTPLNGLEGVVIGFDLDSARYIVLLQGRDERFGLLPANLHRTASGMLPAPRGHDTAAAASAVFGQPYGDGSLGQLLEETPTSSHLEAVAAGADGAVYSSGLSLLASLAPVVEESITPTGVERRTLSNPAFAGLPEVLIGEAADEADLPIADVRALPDDVMHLHNKIMWHRVLPDKVKKTATRLIANGLLTWADLLEDGNLFWEIAFCEKPIWPEPDRWHATICNFLLLLAWEKNFEGRTERLFPSARFQIVRDLYLTPETLARAVALVQAIAQAQGGEVTAARFRDATQLGRKRAIQILEYLDRIGLLRRVGDVHRLRSDSALLDNAARS
jgi:hypothetical protein